MKKLRCSGLRSMFQLLNLEISYSKYISSSVYVYTISPYSASCRHRSSAQLSSGLRCCGSVEMMQAELQHKHRHSTALLLATEIRNHGASPY